MVSIFDTLATKLATVNVSHNGSSLILNFPLLFNPERKTKPKVNASICLMEGQPRTWDSPYVLW